MTAKQIWKGVLSLIVFFYMIVNILDGLSATTVYQQMVYSLGTIASWLCLIWIAIIFKDNGGK